MNGETVTDNITTHNRAIHKCHTKHTLAIADLEEYPGATDE